MKRIFVPLSAIVLILVPLLLAAPGCPTEPDSDGDGLPDSADPCPNDPDNDVDQDGLCGDVDPCPDDPGNDIGGCGAEPIATGITSSACDLAVAPPTGPFAPPEGKIGLIVTGTDGTYLVIEDGSKSRISGGYRSIATDREGGFLYGGGPGCSATNVIEKISDVDTTESFTTTPCCWLESLVVGDDGRLFAVEFPGAGFLDEIDAEGNLLERIQTTSGMQGLALGGNRNLFVSRNDGTNTGGLGGILSFDLDLDGGLAGTFADVLPPEFFQFNWNDGRDGNIAVSETGDLYVGVGRQTSHPSNHTVWRVRSDDPENPEPFVTGLDDNATSPAGVALVQNPDRSGETLFILTTDGRLFGFALPR